MSDQTITTIQSPNGQCQLFYTNGDLVLWAVYEKAPTANHVLWRASDSTIGKPGTCVMQDDGNLVIYDANKKPLWASNTSGSPGATLVPQDDGNLVIYDRSGKPIWATNTHRSAYATEMS